jgi:hypothetical protein
MDNDDKVDQPEVISVADLTDGLTVTARTETVAPSTPTPTRIVAHRAGPARTRNNPKSFGHIDADGNAFLHTPEGQRPIGQWVAGTVDQGYEFFGVKYEDLAVEIDLATKRLADGKGTAEQAATALTHVRQALESPIFMGDITALIDMCTNLETLIDRAREQELERKRAVKNAAREKRELIISEAEKLADSTSWKSTGERFAELLDEWKSAPRVDRPFEQAMWRRFSTARTTFDKARRTHFAQRDSTRREAVAEKEKLIAEATALATSTDWAETSRELRRLMERWKKTGNAGRKSEDALWQRFREAQDSFFKARDAANARKDVEFQANLAAKEELVSEAENLLPIGDIAKAKKSLRSISERWDAIGHVPRGDRDRIESRLRKVEDAVRTGDQDTWRRSNPETRARASDTADKFRDALSKAQRDRAKAHESNDQTKVAEADARIASMEALLAAAEGALAEFSS